MITKEFKWPIWLIGCYINVAAVSLWVGYLPALRASSSR